MYYFDWDENKNRINLEKHGITFEEASTVFFDGKDAFTFRENSIVVTIPFQRIHNPQIALGNKTEDKKPLNERRRKIITEMRNDPNITTAQLRVILGCAETTVENNISYLRKNGYIERVGSRKSGYWKVI